MCCQTPGPALDGRHCQHYSAHQGLGNLLPKTPQTLCLLVQVQKLSVRKIFMPVSRSEDGKAIPHGLADSAMGPTDQFGM